MTTSRAIILAAGMGTRLVSGKPYPKPLAPVAGVPLIVRVIGALARGGVEEVVVVVGYQRDVLTGALEGRDLGVTLRFVENPEYKKPNGNSLLAAREYVDQPVFLLMADHLWSPNLFAAVRDYPLAADGAVLGVDYRIDACFDIDDATKVRVDGDRIIAIDKLLERYDCLDTGVFRVTPSLIEALDAADGPEGCSLSQGVATLAADGRMRVADVGEATWIDVDTPEAHAEAERLLERLGERLDGRPDAG